MHTNNMNACYCGYMNFYEETGEKVEHTTNFIKGDMTKAFLTHQVVAQTSTWIFKRSIVMIITFVSHQGVAGEKI